MWDAPISFVGALKVAVLYFTCAATGSLASAIGDPRELSVGASAGIMGLLGAIAGIMIIIWLKRIYPSCACWCASGLAPDIQRFRSMAVMVVVLVGMTYILGLIPGPTDNYGHLGGMVMGFFMAPLLIPRLEEDSADGEQHSIKRGYVFLSAFLSVAFIGGLVAGLFIMPMQNIDIACGGK